MNEVEAEVEVCEDGRIPGLWHAILTVRFPDRSTWYLEVPGHDRDGAIEELKTKLCFMSKQI